MPTYYVDMAVGADANAGTSEGSGNAWKTIDKAMNTVAAGDKVWVKASADYTEDAMIDTARVGTATAPIIFEGYTTTTGDGGQATMDGGTSCLVTDVSPGTNTYYVFKNFIFTGCTSHGVSLDNCRSVTFKNCVAHTNLGSGFQCSNTGNVFYGCKAYANGNAVGEYGFVTAGSGSVVSCVSYGNSGHGIVVSDGAMIYNTLSYNNGTSGTALGQIYSASTLPGPIVGCTVDGNSLNNAVGIFFDGLIRIGCVVNNIIYNCDGTSGVGMRWDQAISEVAISEHNLVNSNTSNYTSAATHSGEVTSAPSFTNEAGDDYTLASGSPAKAAGVDANKALGATSYVDLGAFQRAEPAAGPPGKSLLIQNIGTY